jgi:carbamoyltransferase
MKYILGISCLYHDSAAALIGDGEILSAAQEERFTRIKHDSNFPLKAIEFNLKNNNISLDDVSYIVFYDKPFLKFERLLETYVKSSPYGFSSFSKAMPVWLREKLFLKSVLVKKFKEMSSKFDESQILFSEHHLSHAASAFFASPFESASILTLDGVGEWATTTIASGIKNDIKIEQEINFPDSLGLLYSAFTYYIGFKVNSGEYKLMGLAPYGNPKYKKFIYDNLIDVKSDGSFKLNQHYFNYASGLTMTNKNFDSLFGKPSRNPSKEKLTQFHMDIAASIQEVTEEIVIKIAKFIKKEFNQENLCLAGGVALNCVANGKLEKEGIFKNIWIQPAAGDAGGSIGAALAAWYIELKNYRKINSNDSMKGSLLGSSFSQKEIEDDLTDLGANFNLMSEEEIVNKTAKSISEEKAVGWFQGKMEFGPRALGSRSILGDPRSKNIQKTLNLKVKYRESFRPFAPSILREYLSEYFELNCQSPYMQFVSGLKDDKRYEMSQEEKNLFGIDKLNVVRSIIPGITHVDYSARIQTVDKDVNPIYYNLIKEFYNLTGIPILINTSFNVRGEPIVCTPLDAYKCFMGTELDILVIGNCYLIKGEQDKNLIEDYKNKYDLD